MERSADPNKQNLLGATALDIALATGRDLPPPNYHTSLIAGIIKYSGLAYSQAYD